MHLFKNMSKKQKILSLVIGFVILIILIYSISILISRIGKVSTKVQYAPYYATVIINDQKVENKTTQYLEPGEYTVTVMADHFETYTNTVTISKDYRYLVGILKPSDDEGEVYRLNHSLEFTEVEGLVGMALNAEGAVRKKNYPILNYLPINNSLYSISYEYDTDNKTPIIAIKATPLYLDDAVAKLKTFKNVDLTSYEIVFKTENPFAIYNESIETEKPIDCIKKSFNIPSKYSLTEGQYFNNDYYFALFYIDDYDMDYKYSHYRILLHKENDKWKVVSAPQPLLTQKNTPNTPKEILDTANSY